MKKLIGTFMALFLMITLVACNQNTEGSKKEKTEEKKPIIAVSIVPEKEWVEAVVGDFADVTVMIPSGKSPANYAPSPKELQLFSDASVYFAIGVPTEKVNILSKTKDINPNLKVVHLEQAAAEKYPERQFESGKRDQHIFISPKRIAVMVQEIEDTLSKEYPGQKEQFEKNAAAYIEKIEEADKEIKTILAEVEAKKFIAYHPAFGYFADDYGLEMIAIEKDGKEATPQRVQEIIDLAKTEDIHVIFYQAEIDSSQSKAIAEEIDGKTVQIAPLAPDSVENAKRMAQTFKNKMEK